jgi:uncharacterized repeat protein (TIGR01451 family)
MAAAPGTTQSAPPAAGPQSGPKIWLGDSQLLTVNPQGASGMSSPLTSGQAQPLSMISADLDGDGIADLVVGYSTPNGGTIAVYRGNLDAFAPQSDASFQAIGRGEFPSPFLPNAQTFSVPVSPAFLATGDFTGQGRVDLALAAKGGSTIYLFVNDGKGGFTPGATISLPGGVTGLAAGFLGKSQPFADLVVGVSSKSQTFIAVYAGSAKGLAPLSAFTLQSSATGITFGDFGDIGPDVAFLSGGQVVLLHSSSLQLETLSLGVNVQAFALGSFVSDRMPGLQIALLDAGGNVQIVAHNEFDPRSFTLDELKTIRTARINGLPNPFVPDKFVAKNGWRIVESIPGVTTIGTGQSPVFFRTRISSTAPDDLMVLNGVTGQMSVVSHPDVGAGATNFIPAQVSTRPYSGSPVAGISARVNIDGRPGVLVVHAGETGPRVLSPLPDPTFTVNRTDDPVPPTDLTTVCNGVANDCSLREAILKANSIAGTDTINVPLGTYTLTLPRVAGDFTGRHGTLEVTDSVNIIGAVDGSGNPTTIVQAGTDSTTAVDKVFSFNQDISAFTTATVAISNLVIQNGVNRGNAAGLQDGFGGAFDFDTGGTNSATATATLTATNCIIQNNQTTDGYGGGIATFNTNGGSGTATLTNSTIQGNNSVIAGSAPAGSGNGGGWYIAQPSTATLNTVTVHNNTAVQTRGVKGQGGGLWIVGSAAHTRTTIHNSTFSGNQAAGDGGGIYSTAGITIDGTSFITNNTAGGDGGGLWYNTIGETATLSGLTITGNSAAGGVIGGGGGILISDGTGNVLNISASRLANNSAPAGKNIFFQVLSTGSAATASNNWFGTNTPASTINVASTCPATAGKICYDPVVVLTHTASPNKIRINQSSTLTGDLSKDNHGNTPPAGTTNVLVGLPITFDNAVLGTIPQAQPETLGNPPTATATYNAGAVGGAGSADATVDQQTVTASIVVLEPPHITKSFSPKTIQTTNSGATGTNPKVSTITFAVKNGTNDLNTVPIDASFTDTLPTNLVVASTPAIVNGCGGTVTATASTGTISFSNTALPVGSCTITVNVSSAVDNSYSNSVTINSTDAGTGNTSSDTLTVINPPTSAKQFGAPTATIPLNGTIPLTITVSSTNTNLTLSGISFNDLLPGGMVVATPSGLSTTCSGTATANAGSGSVSLSGASLAPGAQCTVTANVQGTSAGSKTNNVTASDTVAGTGNTGSASITVIAPPTIAKVFNPTSIALNTTTSLQFTITNPAPNSISLTGVGFTDTLPTGLTVASSTSTVCGGTLTTTAPTGISLTGATIAASGNCQFSVTVTGASAGAFTNITGAVSSTEGGTGNTATANLTVVAPPSIAKAFNPTSIPLNGTTSLTFTITNPAANTVAETGVAFTDTLPTGLTVASSTSTVCGGTLTTTAPTGISLTGATIAVGGNCQFSVTVTGAVSGQYTNTTGAVSSTNGGTGNTASANLTVVSPPSITKQFTLHQIPLNGTTTLTFNITNPNTGAALSGVAFTDTMPGGLVVAGTPNLTNSCNGTATAVAGSSSVSLTGGTLAASGTCSVTVSVQGTTAGAKNNTVQVTSTEGGTGNTANDTVTVIAPPSIAKVFVPASIPLNTTTSLQFTITNPAPNTISLTGVGFTDTLPTGLTVASSTSTVCGGTLTTTAPTGITLTGATVAASGTCQFSVTVTGATAGGYTNTTGAVTSNEGGTGNTATANLTVVAPPSIAKAFNPSTIALNATTSLTFTITNPAANTVAENGVAFTDTLPTGLTVASGTSSVCGGTLTTTAPTGISLVGATIAVGGNCQFSVTVTGAASGQYTNTTGAVTSTNGGTGNTASANLTVASGPNANKQFNPTQIPLNGTSSLSIGITNPNSNVALSGVAFTDSFPAGIVVGATPGASNTCGGTFTTVAGASSVSLSGGSLAAGASCTVSVTIQGTTAGVKNNSVQVTSNEGGAGNTSSAQITVVGPPTLTKAFGAASIPLGGSTSLTFNIANPNGTSLSGIAFSDSLPSGLTISTPNGLATTCSGTITATQGTGSISLSGGSLAASASCTFSVNVTGTAAGHQVNTTGTISSTEGGTGGTATAFIDVVAPPSIAKGFAPSGIPVNGTSTLTFTITNPAGNSVAEAGVAFTDPLPAGLVVATPNNLNNTCGGTATATSGSGTISLAGGTIAVNSNCTVSVNVTTSQGGVYNNTTGNVSSTNGGTGNTASATLTVALPPTIAKAFAATSVAQNGTTSVSFTISNPNGSVTLTGISFTDSLPAGLVVSTPNNVTNNCGGTVTAAAGSSTISFTGGALDPAGPPPMATRPRPTATRNAIRNTSNAQGSCVITVGIQVTGTGTLSNTTGPVSANESGPGSPSNTATIEVVQPPTVNKAFGAVSIPLNGSTSLTFNIANPNTSTVLVNITLSDTLPSGLVVATPNGLTGSCVASSTITAAAGSGSVSLTNLTLPASGSCSFAVNVTGTTAGTKNNTTGNITATFDDGTGTFRPITGGTASASVAVVAPPSIAKAFNPATIAPGTVSTLSFTITNPAANTVAEAGVAFTDTLPSGIVVATPNGLSGSCNGGTVTAVAGSGSISLAGGTIPVAANCVISVNVTGSTPGTFTNVTGAVSSTNGGAGNTATATLNIKHAALSITKTHQGTFHRGQQGAQWTITVSDSASAGPTTGTVSVTDTLPNVQHPPVPTAISGTGWTCTLATLTCTRSDVLAPGASYPAITLTVNIPQNIPNPFTNQATVSGGGDPNPHTASDKVFLGPPIAITSTSSGTVTVTGGNPAVFNFVVDASGVDPQPAVVSFVCTGLPAGSACTFSPLAEGQQSGISQLTMTVMTLPHGSSLIPSMPSIKRTGPLYAAVLFPVFGLLAIGGSRPRNRKKWLRIGLTFGLFMALLALAGCGGAPRGIQTFTNAGTFNITVLGTADTPDGPVQGSATVTLTVQ